MGFVGSDLWKLRQKWGQGLTLWPGVTVIAMNKDGKIWMGKRADNGGWSIVGGFFEMSDSAESCARREVKEELGLGIEELEMIGIITDPKLTYIKYPNGDEVQSPSYVFVAVLKDGTPHQDDEHTDYKWVEIEEVLHQIGKGSMYTTTAMEMYENWLETEEFQIK